MFVSEFSRVWAETNKSLDLAPTYPVHSVQGFIKVPLWRRWEKIVFSIRSMKFTILIHSIFSAYSDVPAVSFFDSNFCSLCQSWDQRCEEADCLSAASAGGPRTRQWCVVIPGRLNNVLFEQSANAGFSLTPSTSMHFCLPNSALGPFHIVFVLHVCACVHLSNGTDISVRFKCIKHRLKVWKLKLEYWTLLLLEPDNSFSDANSRCISITIFFSKIKAIFPKFQESTLAICWCLHSRVWTAWGVVLIKPPTFRRMEVKNIMP